MNIDKIRKIVSSNKNKIFSFKFKGARNQTDEFVGKIVESYRCIFTVRVCDKSNRIKSFSYNDILTKSLEIKEILLEK